MIVFSTCLPLNESVTPQLCMDLIMDWVANKPDTTYPLKYEPVSLKKLKIKKGQNYILLRNFTTEQGEFSACRIFRNRKYAKWYTDCVYFQENGEPFVLIQVSLDCKVPFSKWFQFHKPVVVKAFIDKGYCKADRGIPVLDTPLYMDKQYYQECVSCLQEDAAQALPAVLVGCDKVGTPPLHYIYLARQLGGIAHVFVQKDPETAKSLWEDTQKRSIQGERVGVYFPNDAEFMIFDAFDYENPQALSLDIINGIRTALAGKQEDHPYRWERIVAMQEEAEAAAQEDSQELCAAAPV